ncbi:VWA domain-containing protein [Lutibacter sp. B2]|nr:VWA domain-containing protein [Lutibacter sp. B2]
MKLLNPLGLFLALLLPIIILLHFKKKQIIEQKISNIALWDEVLKEVEGVKSRKINKYFLLMIQILIGILIVVALSKPIWIKGFSGEEITLAIDCSIMMKAEENGKTHFQVAKGKINDYMNHLDDATRINLVLLKKKSEIYLKDSKKQDIKKALKGIKCSNEELNIEYASKFLSTISGKKILITDKEIFLGDQIIKVGKAFENIGITNLNYDYYNNTILCRVKNYGKRKENVVVSMINDQGKKDLQSITVDSNKEKDISFEVFKDSKLLTLKIENKDMLREDNEFIVSLKNKKKVLLIGKNIFLEKALLSIPHIKAEFINEWDESKTGYDVYIVDQEMDIEKLPKDRSIWSLHPKFTDGEIQEIAQLNVVNDRFSKSLHMKGIYTKETQFLKEKKGYEPILQADEKTLMLYGMENEQKRIYSTIDFRKTNLVMTPNFPILINHTIDWLLDGNKISYVDHPAVKLVTGENYKNTESKKLKTKTAIFSFTEIIAVLILIFMVIEWEVYKRAS